MTTQQMFEIIGVIVACMTMLAGGGARYVKMAISDSNRELIEKLDARYVRRNEHNQERNNERKEEELYRETAKEMLKHVEVEIMREHDSIQILLKDILKAVNKKI